MSDQLPDLRGGSNRLVEATPVMIVDPNGNTGQTNVQAKLEQSIEAGNAFSVGTGNVQVPNNSYLKYWLSNPQGSGKRLYVHNRFFSNNRRANQSGLQRDLIINPIPFNGAAMVTPNPLDGLSNNAVGVFGWGVDGDALGTPVIERNFSAANDVNVSIPRIVLPGQSFGYQIAGIGRNNNAVKLSMSVVWIEEPYNA